MSNSHLGTLHFISLVPCVLLGLLMTGILVLPAWAALRGGNQSTQCLNLSGVSCSVLCSGILTCKHSERNCSSSSPRTRRLAIRPSTVPYCPVGYKDCGTCRCVPESTCQWCPGGLHQPVPEPIESTVPGCPPNYVDCGDCLCVPRSTCEWCGVGPGTGEDNSTPPGHNITMRPSVVPYCPESYVDCGTCLCVAEATCQWCPTPYRPTLALPAPSENVTMRPSSIFGCPDSYVDCGTCLDRSLNHRLEPYGPCTM